MRLLLALVSVGLFAGCNSAPSGPVTEEGALEAGDATLASGEFHDTFEVTANEGQWLRVTLASDAFDPYLIVADPAGEQSDLDDSTPGDTTSVTMVLRAGSSGSFRIVATSFRPGDSGPYSLTYEVTDAEPAGGATEAAEPSAADAPPAGAPPAGDAMPEGDGAVPAGDAPKPEETLDA